MSTPKLLTTGIPCANCSRRLYTINTLRPAKGIVVRYKRCPNCGWSCRTEERATSGGLVESSLAESPEVKKPQ
jgi:DNA-directed RNA polymerase subunit RPC12/RpoP